MKINYGLKASMINAPFVIVSLICFSFWFLFGLSLVGNTTTDGAGGFGAAFVGLILLTGQFVIGAGVIFEDMDEVDIPFSIISFIYVLFIAAGVAMDKGTGQQYVISLFSVFGDIFFISILPICLGIFTGNKALRKTIVNRLLEDDEEVDYDE